MSERTSQPVRATGFCSAHQYPNPGERDYTPTCRVCYPLPEWNKLTEDLAYHAYAAALMNNHPLQKTLLEAHDAIKELVNKGALVSKTSDLSGTGTNGVEPYSENSSVIEAQCHSGLSRLSIAELRGLYEEDALIDEIEYLRNAKHKSCDKT